MKYINEILQGDSIEVMQKLPSGSFDFCFADPPYFMQLDSKKKLFRVSGERFEGCEDDWDKFENMESYKDFTRGWLFEVRRLLKRDGSICVISSMQSIYEIGSIMRELGFWVINDIIWQKANPTPNFGGTRLCNSHETLIWAAKGKTSKFTFNYKTGKHLNEDKQLGSIWSFPVCAGSERLKDDSGKKVHSTQKPESLLYRILNLFTTKGDLVLDPFGGTMTTGAVAKLVGRNYTLIERDKNYIKYGKARLESIVPNISDIENATFDKKPLKVAFKDMVKAGCFDIGEEFYLQSGAHATLVEESGKLSCEGKAISMHEVAGRLLGKKTRVNGYDVWKVLREGKLVSISTIRDRYRKVMLGSSN
ncbi:DNA methyltransferase [Helicobacter sp. 13S00401-1]|uniref:site-specific DNA-methyltransferase n=1 Tax=Helicobacter sp. 13S00401-1 TaxID=1905758 RepID=UPI00209C5B31|nr:DNA methyltransferase [Helicobacter sp. 13S00401-1]